MALPLQQIQQIPVHTLQTLEADVAKLSELQSDNLIRMSALYFFSIRHHAPFLSAEARTKISAIAGKLLQESSSKSQAKIIATLLFQQILGVKTHLDVWKQMRELARELKREKSTPARRANLKEWKECLRQLEGVVQELEADCGKDNDHFTILYTCREKVFTASFLGNDFEKAMVYLQALTQPANPDGHRTVLFEYYNLILVNFLLLLFTSTFNFKFNEKDFDKLLSYFSSIEQEELSFHIILNLFMKFEHNPIYHMTVDWDRHKEYLSKHKKIINEVNRTFAELIRGLAKISKKDTELEKLLNALCDNFFKWHKQQLDHMGPAPHPAAQRSFLEISLNFFLLFEKLFTVNKCKWKNREFGKIISQIENSIDIIDKGRKLSSKAATAEEISSDAAQAEGREEKERSGEQSPPEGKNDGGSVAEATHASHEKGEPTAPSKEVEKKRGATTLNSS